MFPTAQLLLSLLIVGGVWTTLANERPKSNIQFLRSVLDGLGTPTRSNSGPALRPVSPRVSVNPQTSSNIPQTPSTNSTSTFGIVAASEASGEGRRHRNRNNGNGRRHKSGSGSHENHHSGSHAKESGEYPRGSSYGSGSYEAHIYVPGHRTAPETSYHSGSLSDEAGGSSGIQRPGSRVVTLHLDGRTDESGGYSGSYRPGYGDVSYHGSYSAEDAGYNGRHGPSSGEVILPAGRYSDVGRPRPSTISIHYDNTQGSRERYHSSRGSQGSSSSSSDSKEKRRRRHHGDSRSKERRHGHHHDSSSNSSD